MKEGHKTILIFSSNLFAFGFSFLFIIIFFGAFFNGGKIHVLINKYGEATLEAILFLVIFIFISIGLLMQFLRFYTTSKEDSIEKNC